MHRLVNPIRIKLYPVTLVPSLEYVRSGSTPRCDLGALLPRKPLKGTHRATSTMAMNNPLPSSLLPYGAKRNVPHCKLRVAGLTA